MFQQGGKYRQDPSFKKVERDLSAHKITCQGASLGFLTVRSKRKLSQPTASTPIIYENGAVLAVAVLSASSAALQKKNYCPEVLSQPRRSTKF